MIDIRSATTADIDSLAKIWHDGWRDGHLAIVPAALARVRTLDSFRARLTAAIDQVRVARRQGELVGFAMFKDDERSGARRLVTPNPGELTVALLDARSSGWNNPSKRRQPASKSGDGCRSAIHQE